MKKILVLALIGMIGIAPEFIGRFAEKQYRQAMEQLSGNPLISLSTVSYERQWFRSRMVTDMELKIPLPAGNGGDGMFAGPLRIELIHDMAHGPLIFGGEAIIQPALLAVTTRMRLPGDFQELVTRIYGEQEPVTINSVSPFFGEHHIRLAMAGTTFTDEDSGTTITMQPATGDWRLARDFASCRGTLNWPGLTGGSAQGSISIEDVTYTVDLQKLNEYIWTGTGFFDLERLGFRAPEGSDFGLTALHVDSDIQEEEGLLHGRGGLSISSLNINGMDYGPATYAVQMRHLDAAAISEIYARQYTLYGRMQGANPEELAAIHDQFGQDLLALLPQLLKKGPEVEITGLSITMPAGEIIGAAKVRIDNSQPELLEQLATLPYAVHADFRLGVPRVLLIDSQVEPQINVWLTAGLLAEQDEMILLHGRFAQGQLTLNGKPLPLLPPGGD